MLRFRVHSCTDVTGFSLMGHSYEMAQGSGVTVHIESGRVPYHTEALELAEMGFIPAGAYRNRDFVAGGVCVKGNISRAMEDILFDPQTSGGLLIAVDGDDAEACLQALQSEIPYAAQIGYVTKLQENHLILE